MRNVVAWSCVLLLAAGGGVACKKKEGKTGGSESGGDMGSMGAMGGSESGGDMGSMGAMGGMTADSGKTPGKKPAKDPKAPGSGEEAVAEGIISEFKGEVSIRRKSADEFTVIKAKDAKVFAGDAVRVGKDGEATIALWDNSTVELTPESAVALNASAAIKGPSPSVTVLSGAVRFDIERRTQDQLPFSVYTPSSVVNVQGTSLAVGVGLSGSSRVAVEDGQVELTAVAKVDAKPVRLAAGKSVVVPLGKVPARVAKYDPDNAGWDEWLEVEDTKGAKRADVTAKTHAVQVDALRADAKVLVKAVEDLDRKTTEVDKKVKKIETDKSDKDYKAVQPKVADLVDTESILSDQDRLVQSRLVAHAYLLGLLHARVQVGIYKVPAPKVKAIEKAVAQVGVAVPAYWAAQQEMIRRRRARRKHFQQWYWHHHPHGRKAAKRRGIVVPAFYAKVRPRRRLRRPRPAIAGWTRPIYRRPRYRGAVRKVAVTRSWRARAWYKAPKWHKRRIVRQAKLAKRRTAWRRAVINRRVKRWKTRKAIRRSVIFRRDIRRPAVRRVQPGVRRPGRTRPRMGIRRDVMRIRGVMRARRRVMRARRRRRPVRR